MNDNDPADASGARQGRDADGQQPPPYDPVAVGRVAKAVDIRNIELVHAHFQRDADDTLTPPAPAGEPSEAEPEITLDLSLEADGQRHVVGYIVRFGVATAAPEPFRIYAFFRLTYRLIGEAVPGPDDLTQFGYWNAVFNAWPYFREFVSNTADRAGLPRMILPVMRIPRQR